MKKALARSIERAARARAQYRPGGDAYGPGLGKGGPDRAFKDWPWTGIRERDFAASDNRESLRSGKDPFVGAGMRRGAVDVPGVEHEGVSATAKRKKPMPEWLKKLHGKYGGK